MLIVPVLLEIVTRYKVKLRLDYSFETTESLRPTFDYLIESPTQLLVVEVNCDNPDQALTQLTTELADMAEWDWHWQTSPPLLYGALTDGMLWQFVALNRGEKRIEQDVK